MRHDNPSEAVPVRMTAPGQPRPHPDMLDPVSRHLLPVLRYFLSALQSPDGQSWRFAYSAAAEIWGEARGLAVAHRTQNFLSALLKSRPVPLRHADPLCLEARAELTEDECLLMALLTRMRADETAQARDMLAALTGGRIAAAAVRTGLELSAVLDAPSGKRRGRQAPVLRAVT